MISRIRAVRCRIRARGRQSGVDEVDRVDGVDKVDAAPNLSRHFVHSVYLVHFVHSIRATTHRRRAYPLSLGSAINLAAGGGEFFGFLV
jgi:hypothetical protein